MESAIQIENLTKDFSIGVRGVKLRAVDNLSLTVEENHIYGLLGPNGSGKSTTMKVILGLLRPTRGKCRLFGIDAEDVQSRKDVGFLPEAPYFYKYLTGRELVVFFAKLSCIDKSELGDRVEAAIEMVGMTEAADRRVGGYSKGMLQRIGLAQALVGNPRLLILDEPTAGVDPIGSAAIGEIILGLKESGKTVLLCSHLLSQVEHLCDQIAIMDRGKLILDGTVSELLGDPGSRSIAIEGFEDSMLEPLKKFLSEYGANVKSVEVARRRLDELFLSKVSPQDEEDKE